MDACCLLFSPTTQLQELILGLSRFKNQNQEQITMTIGESTTSQHNHSQTSFRITNMRSKISQGTTSNV